MEGVSPVCLDDHSCIENRRQVFAKTKPGTWSAPKCQDCEEGRKRERALAVTRPQPVCCKEPECYVEITKENKSGYCRKHAQKARRKKRKSDKR